MPALPALARLAALAALALALLPAAPRAAAHIAPASIPERVSSWGGRFTAVAVADSKAFVAEGDALAVFDIADPVRIARIARLRLGITVASVEVAGGIAYVAGGSVSYQPGTLAIVDVRDPLHPALLAAAQTPGYAERVAVAGDYAYVASDRGAGASSPGYLLIFDIRNPARPALRGAYGGECQTANACSTTGTLPRAIRVVGGRAYVAGDGLVQMFDVQNPAAPRLLAKLPVTGNPQGVDVVGSNAYVVGNNGLQIVDFSNSNAPRLRSDSLLQATPSRIQIVGSLAYIALSDGFQVVDISNPDLPKPGAAYIRQRDGLGADAALAGDRIVLVGDELEIIAVRPGQRFERVGLLQGYGGPSRLFVRDDIAYIADTFDTLRLADIRDPAAPTLKTTVPITGYLADLAVNAGTAYAMSDGALHIVDVRDPAHPALQSRLLLPKGGYQLAVSGTLALVASPDVIGTLHQFYGALQLVDIANPIYAASRDAGLQVLRIDPNGFARVLLPVVTQSAD